MCPTVISIHRYQRHNLMTFGHKIRTFEKSGHRMIEIVYLKKRLTKVLGTRWTEDG